MTKTSMTHDDGEVDGHPRGGGDGYDVRGTLSRTRELILTLASENAELGQLIGEVRQLLARLEHSLEPGELEAASEAMTLRERFVAQRREIAELRARLAIHEDGRRQQRQQLIEGQHQMLMTLHVATHELLEARKPAQVSAILFELVGNLIGCEEVALYTVAEDEEGPVLVLDASLGLERERLAGRIRFGEGLIGAVAASCESVTRVEPSEARLDHERGVCACVPLCFTERPVAVLVLFGLLEHKPDGLSNLDRQILDTLGAQGGLAMRIAELRGRERPLAPR